MAPAPPADFCENPVAVERGTTDVRFLGPMPSTAGHSRLDGAACRYLPCLLIVRRLLAVSSSKIDFAVAANPLGVGDVAPLHRCEAVTYRFRLPGMPRLSSSQSPFCPRWSTGQDKASACFFPANDDLCG